MRALCRKISEIQLARAEKETNKEFDLNYMKLVVELMQRDTFMYAWLCSDYFYEDLEHLYMMHLPSLTDWNILVPDAYHQLCVQTLGNKERNQNQLKHILTNLKIT